MLTVTGIVLSPEYISTIGPGDMVPDPRRFGVFYMSRTALEGIFDMGGAFNNAVLSTLRGTNLAVTTTAVDDLLEQYGGRGAYGRKDQISDTFLANELDQLRAMAAVIPPIFLFVAAFLVNMILTRLITLEREQIGLLKALGYRETEVAWHYLKLTIVIALIGVAIAVALSAAEGRRELATLSAVGAGPAVRRRLAGAQALVISGVGALVGVLLGTFVSYALRATFGAPSFTVPWANLLGVGLGVPLLAALITAACTRSRVPMLERRA